MTFGPSPDGAHVLPRNGEYPPFIASVAGGVTGRAVPADSAHEEAAKAEADQYISEQFRRGDNDHEHYAGDTARHRASPKTTQMAAPPGARREPAGRARHRHRASAPRRRTTGISQATYNASQAQVSALKGQVSSLKGQASGLQTQVSNDNAAVATAQTKAATAQQTANANAAAAYKGREAALAQTYQGKEAALAATQQTVNQQAATLKQELGQVQASSISADGVYVVGQDIKAGTWHTNGDGGQTGSQCYFATLNEQQRQHH